MSDASKWPTCALNEIADIRFSNVDKKSLSGELPVRLCNYMEVYSNDYITDDLSFMDATATALEMERFKVEKGDNLITKDSETPDDIGIPAVVMNEIPNLVCGYHLALIKPKHDKVDPIYLSKQLGSVRSAVYFSKLANGSTRYGLSSSAIASVTIPLAPLEEQRQIANVLSMLDKAIEKTESLIAKYQQIKAGLMHDLFTRGITPDGKLRPPREQAPELYKETPIGWIPKEWKMTGLRAKAVPGIPHLRTGPFGSALKGEHWVKEGRPVITIGALGEGAFIKSELLYVGGFDARRLKDFQLKLDNVVFSRVADVGRSVVVRENQVGWIMSSNLMRISLDVEQVIPDLLQQQLSFDNRLKRQIRAKVNSGGRDVANSEILNQLLFVWPPYVEQQKIVEKATAINRKLQSEESKLDKLNKQKSGLMHDLLTGRVKVKLAKIEAIPA